MTTINDLEAAYIEVRDSYQDSDLNYEEFVRETPLEDFVAECDHVLYNPGWGDVLANMRNGGSWEVYAAAKVFMLYRDEGRIAAITWKLVEGEAA